MKEKVNQLRYNAVLFYVALRTNMLVIKLPWFMNCKMFLDFNYDTV